MAFLNLSKRQNILAALFLLFWAILLRCPTFGNPALYWDEPFYLYAGGQLLHGYLPYIDIWDRKPFGLFLLYAPFALFGKYRFLAYQLGALLCAVGTAILIRKILLSFGVRPLFALGAALFYLPLLNCFDGSGGQTPVFYNLLTAGAFFLILTRLENLKDNTHALMTTGSLAMFLFGLSIEIKPTVVFEGIYLGLFLLLLCWKTQRNWKKLLLNTSLWVFSALLPTLLIIGFYTSIGHFQDWYFANVLSFMQKHAHSWPENKHRMQVIVSVMCLLATILAYRQKKYFESSKKIAFYLTLGWLLTASFAFTLFPPYEPDYTLPLCVPFAICTGLLTLEGIIGILFLIGFLIAAIIKGEIDVAKAISYNPTASYTQLQAEIAQRPGCLFEYNSAPVVLDITPFISKNCHLTKWSFSGHLGDPDEQGSLGIPDDIQEMKNILNQNPIWILTSPFDPSSERSHPLIIEKDALLRADLQTHYHPVFKREGHRPFTLYERNL